MSKVQFGQTGGWAQRLTLWVLPCLCTACFILGSVFQLYNFEANDWDFSYFSVLGWNIGHGFGWHVPFHEENTIFPFYTHHWPPFALVLAPFLWLFESPYTLCVLHGIAIGSSFFLIPRMAKVVFAASSRDDWAATALFVQCMMFFYVPLLAAWRYQTHLTTLVSPSILLALLALHHKRYVWAVLCCLVLASGQERSAVAVFGVGMYAFLLLHLHKLGVGICLFSSLYFVGALKLMVWLRGGANYAFSSGVKPLADIALKCMFVFNFLRYTLFLPFFGKKAALAALCALPTVAIGLVSNRDAMYNFVHHYQDMASLFLLVSALYGCLFIIEKYQKKLKYLVAVSVMMTVSSIHYGGFWDSHPVYVVTTGVLSEKFHDKQLLHQDIDTLLRVSQGKALRVQSGLGPNVSLRDRRYTLSTLNLKNTFSDEVIALSPLAGLYTLDSYTMAKAALDNNNSLRLVTDTGRLRVYAAKDTDVVWK